VLRRALYPGSFDPFTLGHQDVVQRALSLFDELTVAVAANPEKRTPLFSVEDRMEMIGQVYADRPEVHVTSFTGLTVDFARERGVPTLVRGLPRTSRPSS